MRSFSCSFSSRDSRPFAYSCGQFDVAQHDFFHDDAVGGEALADQFGGALANFFALGGEDFAHGVAGNEFAPRGGDDRRHDFFFQRLRQVGFNVVEALGVNLVAHGDGEAEGESLFGLHVERFAFRGSFGERVFA